MESEMSQSGSTVGQSSGSMGGFRTNEGGLRAEIDTSAPFESVKEAHEEEEVDISKLEEQAALLEKDLIVKERKTLDVLKELETTKLMVEELKLKLQKQASDANVTLESSAEDRKMTPALKEEKKDDLNHENLGDHNQNLMEGLSPCPLQLLV
ncbi:hypothetical protein GH714_019086 [Hevea brasiliensis]|uniref:Uncharacterized protein n=1 Tax=Hevea brasiliensis TaxID=3981 RepID=A0A6A6M2K6_HEVBR|nr:hypothetical protein GH714_019086 [Hevea brasiliensis]